jgi:hypothetical protein
MIEISSDAFAADPDAARKVAGDGPVFITQDGQPTHVLMTAAEFERLGGTVRRTLYDAFVGRIYRGDDGGDLDIEKLDIRLRPPSFDDQ